MEGCSQARPERHQADLLHRKLTLISQARRLSLVKARMAVSLVGPSLRARNLLKYWVKIFYTFLLPFDLLSPVAVITAFGVIFFAF